MKKLLPFLVALISIQASAQVITNGLSSYYPFNGNANDMGGGGNHGNAGTCALTTDRFGIGSRAYQLDAIQSDQISINKVLSFGDFTFAYWMLPEVFGNNQNPYIIPQPIDWRNTTNQNPILQLVLYIQNGDKKIQYRLRDNLTPSGSNSVTATLPTTESPWYHIVCTFNATNKIMKLYLNGILIQTQIYTYTSPFTLDKLVIGNNYNPSSVPNYSQKYTGKIDDIYIFNREITDKEVLDLYNEQSTPTAVETVTDFRKYLSIYPNPLSGQRILHLNFTPESGIRYQVKLSNINGQAAGHFWIRPGQTTLQLKQDLPAGNYIFALYNEQGKMMGTQQLAIQ